MKKYTIAYMKRCSDGISLLLSVVPDGMDARSAAMEVLSERFLGADRGLTFPDQVGEITYEAGITLTNAAPKDRRRIVWEGGLTDTAGVTFKYAIRNTRKVT